MNFSSFFLTTHFFLFKSKYRPFLMIQLKNKSFILKSDDSDPDLEITSICPLFVQVPTFPEIGLLESLWSWIIYVQSVTPAWHLLTSSQGNRWQEQRIPHQSPERSSDIDLIAQTHSMLSKSNLQIWDEVGHDGSLHASLSAAAPLETRCQEITSGRVGIRVMRLVLMLRRRLAEL